MRDGTFDQVAPKLEVYTHPATRFVASFVGQANRMGGPLVAIDYRRDCANRMSIFNYSSRN